MKKILFLSSGNGGNLKLMFENQLLSNKPEYEILGSISDRQCGAAKFCSENGLISEVIDFNSEFQIMEALESIDFDLCVTTVHRILRQSTLNANPEKFINLHYSLLPKYAGKIGMKSVDAALENNDNHIGATLHKVSPEVDAGEILRQGYFVKSKNDTTFDTYNHVFNLGIHLLCEFANPNGENVILNGRNSNRYQFVNSFS